jgi:hypothetical protein
MVQLSVPLLPRQEWNCAKAPQAALPFALEPHLRYLLLSLLLHVLPKKEAIPIFGIASLNRVGSS